MTQCRSVIGRLFLACAVVIAGSGCDDDGILTGVGTELPGGDVEARTSLHTLEVTVWPASSGACRMLVGWRHAVCGAECVDPPSPRTSGEAPLATTTLSRADASAPWEEMQLQVRDGPWDVVVHGADEAGNVFLYGCSTVASGDDGAVVRLWRPWCDTAACAGQFHPSCAVSIDCTADPGSDDPDRLGPPRCTLEGPEDVFTWEEDSVSCPPETATHLAPCRPARVRCGPGEIVPIFDGVCPRDPGDDCGGTLETNPSCTRSFPGPCGSCVPGETISCGAVGACTAVATCETAGTWGDCIVPDGTVELCGGGDQDCDGIDDFRDPDALVACNAGRAATVPAADSCSGGGCTCGTGAACAASLACCGRACADVSTSATHCGGCGRACAAGERCDAGTCVPAVDAGSVLCIPATETCGDGDEDCDGLADAVDPDALAECNGSRPATSPRADGCSATGSCRCGTGDPCIEGFACCGGACTDLEVDRLHCGSCENACAIRDTCLSGTCVCDPEPETCNGTDQNCNSTPDTTDPDALEWCNRDAPAGGPVASACGGTSGCRCGTGDACAAPFACCGDPPSCRNLENEEDHCGSCGNACLAGWACVGRVCVD